MDVNQVYRAAVYEWSIGVAGAVTALSLLPSLLHHDLFVVLLLFALGILIEAVPVPLGKVEGSLLISLPVGVATVFGIPDAVWMMTAASLFHPLVTGKQTKMSTIAFNAGQYALGTMACGAVIRWFPWHVRPGVVNWQTLLLAAAGSLVFLVVNHVLVQALQYVRGQFDRRDVWRVFYFDGLNLVIALPFTVLFIAVGPYHPVIAALVLLPMVVLGQTLRKYHHLAYLQQAHETTAKLMSEFDIDRISEAVAETAARMMYADAVAVYLVSPDRKKLLPSFIYPLEASEHFNLEGLDRDASGIVWHVLFGDGMVYVPDVLKDRRVKPEERGRDYRSIAIFPMRTHHDVHGVILCYSKRPYAFGDMRESVWTLARHVGVLFENAKLYQELHELSLRDGATGLYNYRFFYDALERRLQETAANGGELSVAVVDVDFFKKFNDTYGHLAGDTVLRSVGRVLVQMVGPEAIVARYGGEEFALILPMGGERAYELVERIRRTIEQSVVEYDGYRLQGITVSSGIASFPEHGRDGRELLLKADSAMYWGAKQRGRNRTVLYSPDFEAQLFVDQATGLYTYHFLNMRVREEFAHGLQRWGVLCLELDSLSSIVERFGSAAGDKVLREVGILIKECLRQTDLAGRYGDASFLILVPGGSEDEMNVIAQRISGAIGNHGFRASEAVALRVQARHVAESYAGLADPEELFERISALFANLRQTAGQSLA